MARTNAAQKRATNVSLSAELIEEAKRLNVNISQACERGLEEQVAKTRADQWLEENREAIEYWNGYVEEHGLPLARYRRF
ncbi:type II toxin-antitoxin system CcdA family antitoxin [Sphingomonas cavernae]|uniref:Post-segregation antitoxin CcdA n=1 Tax=Sphingomonas cavernae TaxID=2320861 RepID=A0A418WLM6_9SPHN|nr:type II toxin-antitoxin system CcdA family antitoxin [Sphingomonas cavernae]RJF90917.1 post-segregation antitoxin CcdA [Sphingomonas cavernae]